MKFLKYLLIVFDPRKSLSRLVEDNKKTLYSVIGLLVVGILYSISVYVGYLNGFGAVSQPFLAIPAEKYYLYQTFFCVPSYFLIVIVFAGVARLIASVFKGSGNYESLFAIYGLSIVLPTLITMWLPETYLMVVSPKAGLAHLAGIKIWPEWVDNLRQVAGVIWPLVITIMGVKISEKLSYAKSVAIGLVAFIPAVALIAVFIR